MQSELSNPPRPAGAPERKCTGVNVVFFGLAAFCALMAVFAARLQVLESSPWPASKTLWACLAAALGLGLVPPLARRETQLKLVLLLTAFGLAEAALQAAAWAGVLPGVNTKYRCPWGRVYWTAEGRGNSIRNRYGWHSPEFDLRSPHRIAVIGDSFVEAVEVPRDRNMGVQLAGFLADRGYGTAVLPLGCHGTGPAHYLEILEYAWRRFQIREAIVVICLGNDVADCSPKTAVHPGGQFFYYQPDPEGGLALRPGDELVRARFAATLDRSHLSYGLFLPRILSSHCMGVQLALSLRDALGRRRLLRRETSAPAANGPADAELAKLGLRAAVFDTAHPHPETREAMTILEGLLERASDFCASRSIEMRVATVPFFPRAFYATQSGTDWTARLGDYDFLAPEREIGAWARRRGVPILPFGEWLKERGTDTAGIRELYLSDGSGHFSEAGHLLFAGAMAESFFSAPAPVSR